MFTFSFGSAFGLSYDKGLAEAHFAKAMEAAKKAETVELGYASDASYNVDYSVLEVHRAEIFDAVATYEKKAETTAYVEDVAGLKAALLDTETDNEGKVTKVNEELVMALVAEQYKADKAEALEIIGRLTVSDYSTTEMSDAFKAKLDANDECKTYQEHVQELIDDAIKAINDADDFNDESTIANYKAALDVIYGNSTATPAVMPIIEKAVKNPTALIAEEGYEAGSQYIGLGTYKLNKKYVAGTGITLKDFTTTAVAGQDAVDAADIAATKAAIATAYAKYLADDDADKTKAADVKTMLDFLAEESVVASNYGFDDVFKNAVKSTVSNALTAVDNFNATAATYAAEKDATGALVRDAKDVDKYVTKGTVNAYATALGISVDYTKYPTIANCTAAIKNLQASLDDAKLAYAKKLRETKVADLLADFEEKDTYYPAELAKVKDLTAEYLEKVNAVTDLDKVGQYDVKYFGTAISGALDGGKLDDILLASEVDAKTMASGLKGVAEDYVTFLNKSIKKADNQYYVGPSNVKLYDELKALVGNTEARTSKEIDALSEQVIAMVKTLPTNAAVDAAKEAADDAIDALPTKVSTADKAAIDAAKAAVDAYEDLSAVDYVDTNNKLAKAVTAYAYAFRNEMVIKTKAVGTTDKAAIEAIIDEIEAFVDTYDNENVFYVMDGNGKATDDLAGDLADLQTYLDNIQKDAAAAVTKAIAAIPVGSNITEADKATVENARKLYDAYVAEYTDYTDYDYDYTVNPSTPTDGFVADDFAYQTLFNAETLLGLNNSPAKDVEALKITARSTAKKGSITVKWTVKGEADIDGYQIWKSTKANKGYKKAFTTTKKTYKNTKGLKKGTRYYYKIRAYKVIDGKNVYSDWSNKANRKAK